VSANDKLVYQVTERLAILDRVRPILAEAIRAAQGEEAVKIMTVLGVRLTSAILLDPRPPEKREGNT